MQPITINAQSSSASPTFISDQEELGLDLIIPPVLKKTVSAAAQRDVAQLSKLSPAQQLQFQNTITRNGEQSKQNAHQALDAALRGAGIDITDESDIALALTGSDGRGENPLLSDRSLSPMELVVCTRNRTPSPPPELQEQQKATIEKIREVVQKTPSLQAIFHPFVETKDIGGIVGKVCISDHPSVVPTRVIDLLPFLGNREVVRAIEGKLIDELKRGLAPIGKFNDDFVKHERTILENQLRGMNTAGVHLTIVESAEGLTFPSPGILTYNAADQNQRGPKHGGMRYMQFSVAYFISKKITKMSPEVALDFISKLPKNLPARVECLKNKRILTFSDAETRSFRDTYINLIFWYTTLQSRAHRTESHSSTCLIDGNVLHETLLNAYQLSNAICDQAKR